MPGPNKHKHRYALWRVNVDGTQYEGRWAHAAGAVAGALDRHLNVSHGACRRVFTDLVIHVEQIGEPDPHPATSRFIEDWP